MARADLGSLEQRGGIDLVGVREPGLLTADRAHAHALFDRMRAFLDDAVFHRPALATRVLEIEVAEIDARAEQRAEGAFEATGVEAGRQQEAGFGELDG